MLGAPGQAFQRVIGAGPSAIARLRRCSSGVAYLIYRAATRAAPVPTHPTVLQ